jgi:rhodanese-related sulfurtransferase
LGKAAVEVPEVTPEEIRPLLDAGAVLLDVREQEEWDAGHAPAASHIPMRDVAARIAEIPADRRVLAICRVGGRSRTVARALIDAGYDAYNVAGGMHAWAAADLPVEATGGATGEVV